MSRQVPVCGDLSR